MAEHTNRDGVSTPPTFFTVSNAGYFPGTVALLNSLRLTGNPGELVVLDVNLSRGQKDVLAPHCSLVKVPHEIAINPLLLKAFPALLTVSGVVVIIDSDIIVTGSLSRAVDRARDGKVCVYPDTDSRRWFSEWSELFGLAGPLRRQTYVNSGFVTFSPERWPELLHRWQSLSEHIESSQTRAGGAARDTPLWDGDQDAFNALLMSEIPAEAIEILPYDEAPTSYSARHSMRVHDVDRLTCSQAGLPSIFVHASGTPKPWQFDGWRRQLWHDGYARLLPRVLFADDVTIRLRPADLPLWARPGRLAHLGTRGLDLAHAVSSPLPARLRSSVASFVQRHRSVTDVAP